MIEYPKSSRITWSVAVLLLMPMLLVGCGRTSSGDTATSGDKASSGGRGASGEALETHSVANSTGDLITYYFSVKVYENDFVTFAFTKATKRGGTGLPSNGQVLPELPASKYPDAIAAFAKFAEWEKACLDKKAELQKDFPNPWGKGKFLGYPTIGSSLEIGSSFFHGDDIKWFAYLTDKFTGLTAQAREKMKKNKEAGDLLK